MESEFRLKDGDWYYYDEQGRLLQNKDIVIDGYRYIFQSSGAAYQGLWKENGKIIGFDPMGRQAFDTGVKHEGYWYYFDAAGTMRKNYWRVKDGNYYYYNMNGHLYLNKGVKIEGYWYYFTANGSRLQSSWRTIGSDRCLLYTSPSPRDTR